jgi:hypothetical protein
MSDFDYANTLFNTIFIKPQDGATLPEGFRDLFLDEQGSFTYEKTRPTEEFDDYVGESSVGDVRDNTLTIDIEAIQPPHAWLSHLSAKYPDLLIECEHQSLADALFGRTVWLNGEVIYRKNEKELSLERFDYFGGDSEECEDWYYTAFGDKENREAVEEVRTAHEAKDWLALMEGLFTARSVLQSYENENLDEDTLRVAMVTVEASLAFLNALTTDPVIDTEPLTALFGCVPDDDDDADDLEPEEPSSREDLLVFVGTQAVESARLLSLAKHHEVTRRVKELVPELQWRNGIPVAQEAKINLTDLEDSVFALLPQIDDDTCVDDLVALFENATESVHPDLVRIAAHRVGYFLDGGGEPDDEEYLVSGEQSRRIVNAVKDMAEGGESDRDVLLDAIAKLQVEWFWGEMRIDAGFVNAINGYVSRIENSIAESHVRDFVYWNILEPWEEFEDEGSFPDDEDYMESFSEWKVAVGTFLEADVVEEPSIVG